MGWMLFLSLLYFDRYGDADRCRHRVISSFFVLATHNINLVLILQRLLEPIRFRWLRPAFYSAGDLLAKGNVLEAVG